MNIEDVKEGQCIKYKFKRTQYFLIYEKDMEWYRCERLTNKSREYTYFMFKELPVHYSLKSKEHGTYSEVELMTNEEIDDHEKMYRGLKYKVK